MRRLLFQQATFDCSYKSVGYLSADSGGQFSLAMRPTYISFNHKNNTTDAEGFVAYNNRCPTPDVIAQARYSANARVLYEIGIRCDSAASGGANLSGYYLICSKSSDASMGNVAAVSGKSYIIKRVGTTTTKLASVAFAPTDNSTTVLRFEAKGQKLLAYLNGSLAMSASDSVYKGPGFVRWGIGANVDDGTAAVTNLQIVENRHQAGHATFAAFDEARGDIYFNLGNGEQYVYDTALDEWFKRDMDAVGFGQFIDSRGEKRLLYGTSSGYLNVLSADTQHATTNFTGTWTSNWFDLGDDVTRKRLTSLFVELTKQSTNTQARIRIERSEHPDLPSAQQEFALYTINPHNRLSPQFGGRFIRITVIHAAAGNLEIHQIKQEVQAPRPALRGIPQA